MNRFQEVWSKLAKRIEPWSENQFQNVWAEFGEGIKESFGTQGSKAGP